MNMKKMMMTLVLAALACGTANAQFGGLGKALKDKAKQKVEQVKKDAKDKAKDAVGIGSDTSGEGITNYGTVEEETQPQQFEKSPTEIDRERRAKIVSDAVKPIYAKIETSLKALEEAVENGNDQYV